MSKSNSKSNQKKQSILFNIYDLIPSRFMPIEDECDRVYCNLCDQIFKNDITAIKNHWFLCSCINKSFKNDGPRSYQCHACETGVLNTIHFNSHILTDSHKKKCSQIPQYSFYSTKNDTMIYAPAEIIKKRMKSEGIHHCHSVPVLSKFMKVVLDEFVSKKGINNRWYACIPCNLYAKIHVHSKKSCYNCKTQYYCNSCKVEIICNETIYKNHIYGYEHNFIMNKINMKTGKSRENFEAGKNLKLPRIILNRFEIDKTTRCRTCNKQCATNEHDIMTHLTNDCGKLRLHDDVVNEDNNYCVDVNYSFKCLVCKFGHRILDTWKFHVLSPLHLSRCHQIETTSSNFCDMCCTYFYGDSSSTTCKMLGNHKKTSSSSSLTTFMAKIYKERNDNSNNNTLYYYDSPENFKLNDADSIATPLYCTTCNVAFFSSLEIYEKHTLTAEHIIILFGCSSQTSMCDQPSRLPSAARTVLKPEDRVDFKHFQVKSENSNVLRDYKNRVLHSPRFYEEQMYEDNDSRSTTPYPDTFNSQFIHGKSKPSEGLSAGNVMTNLQDLVKNVENDLVGRSAATDDECGGNVPYRDSMEKLWQNPYEMMIDDEANHSIKWESIESVCSTEYLSVDDRSYLLYVGHRLKRIKDEEIKLKVKLAIDDVFCKSMKYSDL